MDTLRENLEEGNWVFDAFKVRGNVQSSAEALSLALGGRVFLEYCRVEALGDILLCRILVADA